MAEKRCNQADLIRDLNLGSNTVGKLFHGSFSRIDKETIEKILDYFDCDFAELFDLIEEGEVNAKVESAEAIDQ